MSEFNAIGNRILQEFISEVEKRGLTVSGMNPETGQLTLQSAQGQTLLVSLINLVEYYYRTRDKNAVNDFAAKVVATVKPEGTPGWGDARGNIYVSLYPLHTEMEPPFAKEVSDYSCRFFIRDTPDKAIWISPEHLAEWGVTEAVLERQALANGDLLLAETGLKIDDVEGRRLGSFRLRDRTLNAALLMAPALKDSVRQDFGWPLYAVIPNKITCCFFGQADFDFFEDRLANLVASEYESPRRITPELLEFSDNGIRPICTWTKRMGYIIKFDCE